MNIEKACGAVVFTRENHEIKYVIIQQTQGFHGFPKGHMEDGETELQTALREIREEIGTDVTIVEGFRTVDTYLLPEKADTMKQVIFFLAECKNQSIAIQESELLSAANMTFDEALNALEYESSKRILREANDFLTCQMPA